MEQELNFLQKERLHTGFGEDVSECKSSAEVLEKAGMNWTVEKRPLFYMSGDGEMHEVNAKANVREEDGRILGTVSDRYEICQNADAFRFTDDLIGEGVRYVRAGSFRGGRSVWIEAELPETKRILGDSVRQHLIFLNSHDGSGAVRVLVAPIRIICSNALNLFIRKAQRAWSVIHTSSVSGHLSDAETVLFKTEEYMKSLDEECSRLNEIHLTACDVEQMAELLFPMPSGGQTKWGDRRIENVKNRRRDLQLVYREKEDLKELPETAYRFVNAVSDYATHANPIRETREYNANLFEKTANGHPLVDKAMQLFV